MVLEDRLGRGGAVLAEMRSAMPHVSPHESLKALMEDRGLKHKNICRCPVTRGRNRNTQRPQVDQQGASKTIGGVLPRARRPVHLNAT